MIGLLLASTSSVPTRRLVLLALSSDTQHACYTKSCNIQQFRSSLSCLREIHGLTRALTCSNSLADAYSQHRRSLWHIYPILLYEFSYSLNRMLLIKGNFVNLDGDTCETRSHAPYEKLGCCIRTSYQTCSSSK